MTAVGSKTEPEAAAVLKPRSWKTTIAYGVTALVAFIVFGLNTETGVETTFSVARDSDFFTIPDFGVAAQPFALALTALALALAGLAAWGTWQRRTFGWWLPTLYGAALLFALLSWAGAGKEDTSIGITRLFEGGLFLAVPLVFGAIAGTLCERSGVINIAIEGQLLFGAFLAAVVASASGSAAWGLIAAPVAGALVGAALAIFAVKYWVDQIVVGVVLNVLVLGITGFLFGTVLRDNPEWNQAMALPEFAFPGLSNIPVIGPVLFDQNLLVWIMYVVVIAFHMMLFKTRWGLRVRSVGEHPKAADTVGIKVNRTRVSTTILGGAVAGLGGAFFTIAAGLAFGKDMTNGKGFIALAAMILGRWSPKGALAAALLFGIADNLQVQFGIIGAAIPSEFMLMTPYLATIFAVAGVVGHVRPPASEGKPYKK